MEYRETDAYIGETQQTPPPTRTDFLYKANVARIAEAVRNVWYVGDGPQFRAVGFAMSREWIDPCETRRKCNAKFRVWADKAPNGNRPLVWRGHIPKESMLRTVRKWRRYAWALGVGGVGSVSIVRGVGGWLPFWGPCTKWAMGSPNNATYQEFGVGQLAVYRLCSYLQEMSLEHPGRFHYRWPPSQLPSGSGVCGNAPWRNEKGQGARAKAPKMAALGLRRAANAGGYAFRLLEPVAHAIRGEPRGVEEIEISRRYAGMLGRGTRYTMVVWQQYNYLGDNVEMAHTSANRNAGEVAVEALDSPFPPELCRFATNHTAARRSAFGRCLRNACGWGAPSLAD